MRISVWSSDVCSSDLGGAGMRITQRLRYVLNRHRASYFVEILENLQNTGRGFYRCSRRLFGFEDISVHATTLIYMVSSASRFSFVSSKKEREARAILDRPHSKIGRAHV